MRESRISIARNPLATRVLRICATVSAAFIGILLLSESRVFAQAPTAVWAKKVSDTFTLYEDGNPPHVAIDRDGNTFFVGGFSVATFPVGGQTLTNTSSVGDQFIVKFTSDGDVLWVRQIGGDSFQGVAGHITVDNAGDLVIPVVTGSTNITVGTNSLSGNGGYQVALVDFDPQGDLNWMRLIAGSGMVYLPSAATDSDRNIFLTGVYSGTNVNFGTNSLTKSNPAIGADFLVKYDPTGNLIWATQVSLNESNQPLVTVDGQGNSYLYVSFSGVADFGTVALTNNAPYVLAVAKFNPDGNLLWARVTASGDVEHPVATADEQGNNYVAGYGNPQLQNITLPHGVAFVAKYDNAGNVVWGNSIDSNPNQFLSVRPTDVSVDSIGNCYVSGGTYAPSISFGDTILTNSATNNYGDGFIAKYSNHGDVLWARLLTQSVGNFGDGVADSQGNVYYYGFAMGTNLFNLDGIVLQTLTNNSLYYFAAKISGPALSIQLSGNNVVISWPTNAVGLSLESSANLNGGWSPVTNSSAVVGEQFVVTNAISGSSRYYRLRNF